MDFDQPNIELMAKEYHQLLQDNPNDNYERIINLAEEQLDIINYYVVYKKRDSTSSYLHNLTYRCLCLYTQHIDKTSYIPAYRKTYSTYSKIRLISLQIEIFALLDKIPQNENLGQMLILENRKLMLINML